MTTGNRSPQSPQGKRSAGVLVTLIPGDVAGRRAEARLGRRLRGHQAPPPRVSLLQRIIAAAPGARAARALWAQALAAGKLWAAQGGASGRCAREPDYKSQRAAGEG